MNFRISVLFVPCRLMHSHRREERPLQADPVHPHETTASRLSRPSPRRSTALSLHNRRTVHPTLTPAAAAHASLALHAP
eukprot:2758820-Prymnesium_polylepis.1